MLNFAIIVDVIKACHSVDRSPATNSFSIVHNRDN